MTLLFLCFFAFLAGFIDSIVGGGGLILLPALLILRPDLDPTMILGTNKGIAVWGTLTATLQYSRSVGIPWRIMLPAALSGFIFSALGAFVVTKVDNSFLRPFIIVLLIAVAIYTFFKKDFGNLHAPTVNMRNQQLVALGAGAAVGFYDGFFGPGTGSFLIFIFIGLIGFGFLAASASSKLINFATNVSATLFFAFTGHIAYTLVLPLALCMILGSILGSRVAVVRGSSFVRVLFLCVVTGVILRLSYDTFLR
ncbi:MAG: sulfite exporter TauE/SafE family protein [Trueperaceae bacterium]